MSFFDSFVKAAFAQSFQERLWHRKYDALRVWANVFFALTQIAAG